ncbi:D-alanine--D-alanine ligase family protein [Pseudomonas syringae]|uniref:D-alanine--D-alanine ligase family protein n=1 Tax=Pseudomonas syringae TaxID=317 RepID=UPI002248F374|nr:ATP-grasp domain-containing protein [Pseudomonas syringae]UZS66444.1 ATP-grasp domain-containing protein [Pseudomonas syringae]
MNNSPDATLVVSIAFGGHSPEHEASIDSFSYVYECLSESRISINSIYFFDMHDCVHRRAYDKRLLASDYMQPQTAMTYIETLACWKEENIYILNLLHGRHGEDGSLQGAASVLGLRGSFGSVLASSLSMSKFHMGYYAKSVYPSLQTPSSVLLKGRTSLTHALWDSIDPERAIVIKPNASGSSINTERYPCAIGYEALMVDQLERMRSNCDDVLIQQYIEGVEYSVGCMRTANGEVRTLPVVRITSETGFFGYLEKNTVGSVIKDIVNNDDTVGKELQAIARTLFSNVGFSSMCRFDFIVKDDSQIYFLEANSIPGLMKNSLYPKMLRAAGIGIVDLVAEMA